MATGGPTCFWDFCVITNLKNLFVDNVLPKCNFNVTIWNYKSDSKQISPILFSSTYVLTFVCFRGECFWQGLHQSRAWLWVADSTHKAVARGKVFWCLTGSRWLPSSGKWQYLLFDCNPLNKRQVTVSRFLVTYYIFLISLYWLVVVIVNRLPGFSNL